MFRKSAVALVALFGLVAAKPGARWAGLGWEDMHAIAETMHAKHPVQHSHTSHLTRPFALLHMQAMCTSPSPLAP